MAENSSIQTIKGLAVDDLVMAFNHDKPIKFECVDFKDSLSHWNVEYLSRKIGDAPVHLMKSRSKRFDYTNFEGNGIVIEETQFSQALQCIYQNSDSDACYYIQQCPVRERLPELTSDLGEMLALFSNTYENLINLWVGQTGAISPLHYDDHGNFLQQVEGSKTLTLFSPDDSRYLYPNLASDMPHVSLVDINNIDENEYPLFDQASSINFTLNAGDILYMPKNWWHQVKTLDTGISINYWFEKKSFIGRLRSYFDR